MNRADIATIAVKDLRAALRRRGIVVGLLAMPLIAAVGLPLALAFADRRSGGIPATALPSLLSAFQFFFVIGAATLPTTIASYALVGEKIERSLEPLLATPVAAADVLLGKAIAAFAPAVLAGWAGQVLFMAIADLQARPTLGHLYFPNATAWLILLVVAPLTAAVSVEISILVSARATEVRTAQQLVSLMVIPFAALYVATEVGAVTLDPAGMGTLAVVLAVLAAGLSFAVRAVFNREEILTRWK